MKKGIIKSTIVTLASLFVFNQSSFAQLNENKDKNEIKKENLVEVISDMTDRFNQYRVKISEIYVTHGSDSKEMLENEQFIAKADAKNLEQAKQIFEGYGFPTQSMVGIEKSHDYWMIVLNSDMDSDFQLQVLKAMDKLLDKDEVAPLDYAYLTDRVRLNIGKTQVYGTQIKYNETTKSYEPYELEKPETVNQRREKMGLEPMEGYIRNMNSKYQGSLKRNKDSRRLKKKV